MCIRFLYINFAKDLIILIGIRLTEEVLGKQGEPETFRRRQKETGGKASFLFEELSKRCQWIRHVVHEYCPVKHSIVINIKEISNQAQPEI